jgi:predicted membrane protein
LRDLGRVLFGLVVIAIGTLYLLERADVLDAGRTIDNWWPTVVIATGMFQLVERSHRPLGSLALVAGGTLLLLGTTDVIQGDVWSYAWPLLFIVAGVVAIARWAGAGPLPRDAGEDVVVASGIFGGPELANASQSFRGASLTAVFGGVVLDLRDARPAPPGARITATAVFGGVDILVPHGWRIAMKGTPIFGGVTDKTKHGAELPADAPSLYVDAFAVFGGVEVKHEREKK